MLAVATRPPLVLLDAFSKSKSFVTNLLDTISPPDDQADTLSPLRSPVRAVRANFRLP